MRRAVAPLLVWALLPLAVARADSPGPTPKHQEFRSANGAFLLEIDELDTDSPNGASVRRQRQATPEGADETTVYVEREARTVARVSTDRDGLARKVVVETTAFTGYSPRSMRLTRVGQKAPLWQADLGWVPAGALVSNSGRYVATFDEHGAVGRTRHVVALFGPDGSLIRSYSLSDLLSEEEQRRVTHSVSNVWWAGIFTSVGHHFDANEDHLVLAIALDAGRPDSPQPPATARRIDLQTGKVLP